MVWFWRSSGLLRREGRRIPVLVLALVAAAAVACSSAAPPAAAPATKATSVPSAAATAGRPTVASAPAPVPSASPAAAPLSQSTLHFGIAVSSGLQVLPQLALDAGYFKDEGLNVTITHITGQQNVLAALNRGDLNMSNGNAPEIVQARLKGIPVRIIAVPVVKPIFDFMVGPDIHGPSDLKGKKIALTSTNVCDSTCFQVTKALQAWGLDPKKDVQFVGLKDYPGMFAALTSNQVAAAPLAPPYSYQAAAKGFHSLQDFSKVNVQYPSANVETTDAFIKAHPDTILAFLRAYVKAIHRYKTDKAFALDVYRRFLNTNDTTVLTQTWEYYSKLMQDNPTPTTADIRTVLDGLTTQGISGAAAAQPSEFFDPTFMQKVQGTSGR